MKKCINNILGLLLTYFIVSCSKSNERVNIIPEPLHIKNLIGNFEFTDSVIVYYNINSEEDIAKFFCHELKSQFNLNLSPSNNNGTENTKKKLIFNLGDCNEDVGSEGYVLKIRPNEITLCANMQAGLFYAAQSLLQILPVNNDTIIKVPCIEIIDHPQFAWRGAQLDVATHFFDKEFVKKYINILAMHKINMLLLQLSNDYGWRVETNKYPKLTSVGAWREDRRDELWSILPNQRPDYNLKKPFYGGYYSQKDIKEIVDYAEKRFVTVIPQIQFPGNIVSVLASYPNLSCSGDTLEIPSGKSNNLNAAFCLGNDSVYSFMTNVLDELIELFPNSPIFIDGYRFSQNWKTCEKCQTKIKEEHLVNEQDLLKYAFEKVESHIVSRGRTIVGTENLLFQKLTPGAIISFQRNEDRVKQAIEQKHKIVFFPVDQFFFSSYQNNPDIEPIAYPNKITLKEVYTSNIIPEDFKKDYYSKLLGLQSGFLTDFVQTPEMAEYMLFPRMCALSEKAWSKSEQLNWNRFQDKMKSHYYRLDKQDINYFVPAPIGLKDEVIYDKPLQIVLTTNSNDLDIHYTVDGTIPTIESTLYTAPVEISKTSTLKAKSFLPNGKSSRMGVARFTKTAAIESLNDLVNIYPGIKYHYYNGVFRKISDIYNSKPLFTRISKKIGIPNNIYLENFALIFEGLIFVQKEGIYSFYLSSDDGSKLYLGNEMIIDNDGIHGGDWKEGQVALKAGYHNIKIEYFDLNLNEKLQLEYEGPDIERKEIPESILFYQNIMVDDFTF